ncbi:SoxR reducing system RseC family protein [Pseudomonadota bacterium]
MIEEPAVILECVGDYAQVQTERSSACGSCSSRSACETASLKEEGNKEPDAILQVLNPINALPGERVVIGFEEEALTKASMALYAVPLVSFILFAIIGQWLASSEAMAALGGVFGLAVGLLWLRYFSAKVGQDEQYTAVVLRRVGEAKVELECSINSDVSG